tara:strand:- start:2289 stop:3137 length:849 start_codon:yes stop_codon:yes gene_type:complete
METNLEKKYKKYYKYKLDYEEKKRTAIKNIKKDKTLSLKMEREKIKQLRESGIKCPNCRKSGGNIFSNDSGMLRVVCGNIDDPCKVGGIYDVEVSRVANLRTTYAGSIADLKSVKHQIIKTKLDYLFGYANEETTLAEFEILKNKIKSRTKQVNHAKIAYENVVQDKETEEKRIALKKEIDERVNQIKDDAQNFLSSKQDSMIKIMVEQYCKLHENNAEYRLLNYGIQDVIVDDENAMSVSLVQKPFEYDSLFVPQKTLASSPKFNQFTGKEQGNFLSELMR